MRFIIKVYINKWCMVRNVSEAFLNDVYFIGALHEYKIVDKIIAELCL